MNIAFFLTPKCNTAFLYDFYTLRQGLEKMRHHGYTAIPVIDKENQYVGTISEGDFLWHIVDEEKENLCKTDIRDLEDTRIKDILNYEKNPPVRITADLEALVVMSLKQSFIPVIDDYGTFIGIVTRNKIIEYYYKKSLEI